MLAETGQTKGRYSIEVLSRAIDILCAFSHARPSMGLAEIVQAVRLPKTTVFRARRTKGAPSRSQRSLEIVTFGALPGT